MKRVYVFNVSKAEYGEVRVEAHSDEEAEDRCKEALEEENVDWRGKPEYSWDLGDILGEDGESEGGIIEGEAGNFLDESFFDEEKDE